MEPESCAALLIQLLNEEQPCAFYEYAMRGKPVPAGQYFVTVAAEAVRYQSAMEYKNGIAVPVSVTLRIRQHCRTDVSAAVLLTRLHGEILPALERMQMQVTKLEQKEIHHDRTLDRFVLETLVTAEGLLLCLPEEEGAEADADNS